MVKFAALRPDRGSKVAPVIFDFEDYDMTRAWFAVIPVRTPPRVRLDEDEPVCVHGVPRIATSSRSIKLQPSVKCALLKRDRGAILVLRGCDEEEVLALASLVDADAAVRLYELVRDIEDGNVAEVRVSTTAPLGVSIFGGV